MGKNGIRNLFLGIGTLILVMACPIVEMSAQAADVIELRAGCATPKEGPEADAVDKFAELVSQKTNGKVKVINLYTALGVEQQLIQQVMTGSVDIGTISNGNVSRWTTALHPYDLPFLFKSNNAAADSMSTPVAAKAISKLEKDLGVKFLCATSPGSGRDIQTRNKPLRVPANIKGLKIRTVSTPMDLAVFKAWGANPTPIDWGQTYTALQQGVVDGEGISLGSFYTSKHYEMVKHILRIDYQAMIEVLLMNQAKFNSLSPEHQKAIMEGAREAEAWNRKHEAERAIEIQEKLKKEGVTLYTPTPQEYAQWVSIRETVWKEVDEKMKGKIDWDMVENLKKIQK